MTDGENGAAPTRVSWVGLWAAIVAYLFLLALGLLGPVLMVLAAFAGTGHQRHRVHSGLLQGQGGGFCLEANRSGCRPWVMPRRDRCPGVRGDRTHPQLLRESLTLGPVQAGTIRCRANGTSDPYAVLVVPGRTVTPRHRHMFDSAGLACGRHGLEFFASARTGAPRPSRRRLPAVVRRAARHGSALAAVAVTVLLCATALAALAALAGSSVQDRAVRRLAGRLDAQASVSASFRAGGMAAADRDVRAAVERVFAGVPQRT
jgi:hypothetical protein